MGVIHDLNASRISRVSASSRLVSSRLVSSHSPCSKMILFLKERSDYVTVSESISSSMSSVGLTVLVPNMSSDFHT